MREIGTREARKSLPALLEAAADGGTGVMVMRHNQQMAALLPPEAAEVWERHLAERERRQREREAEAALGERFPAKSTPVCPFCKSSYMQVFYTGELVGVLVNLADPAAGIQAITADAGVDFIDRQARVRCASCWEEMSERPRRHGHPAYNAASDIAEDAPWPDQLAEAGPVLFSHRDTAALRAARIVEAHDLARGALQRVSLWEALTGITDAERNQIRKEREAAGLTDDDPW